MDDKTKQAVMQEAVNKIAHCAMTLYDLMESGQVVDISFPEEKAIIVPNQPPKKRRLLIMKPLMHVTINSN